MLVPKSVIAAVAVRKDFEKQGQATKYLVGAARVLGGSVLGYGVGEVLPRISGYHDENPGLANMSKVLNAAEGGLLALPGSWSRMKPALLPTIVATEVGLYGLNQMHRSSLATVAAAKAQQAAAEANARASEGVGDSIRDSSVMSLLQSPTMQGAGAGALLAGLAGGAYALNRPLTERERLDDDSRTNIALRSAAKATIPGALAGGVIAHFLNKKS